MDSGNNSGSMQSSDEEYESRGESFTSFLNPSSAAHFGSVASDHHHHHHHPPPPPPLLPQQYQNTLLNLEAAFAQSSSGNNTQYGNDVVWSRGLRSQNNHHPNFENFVPLSSSSSSNHQSLFGASSSSQMLNQPQFATSSSSTMPPSQSGEGNLNPPSRAGSDHQSVGNKNPKKRTRASRRAPTTVLTTDTTNFRQMVQEFTGIPAAPFSSSPYSRRLDLFSGGGMRSANLDALNPLYPLRPSAQKFQISPFLPQSSSSSSPSSLLSSTMIEALVSATNQSTTNNASSTTPENLLSMHNQILSFQHQQQHTSLKNSSSILGTKSLTATTASNALRSTTQQGVPVTSLDDFGLNHENVNENVGNIQQQQLGSNISGNYQFNCSASTSEFHSDKGLENVSSSGEGTVGQWVCPDH